MYSVTSAPQSLQDDQSYRMRRYLLSMGTRTLCFLLAVLFLAVLHWTIAGWAMVIGAVVLPYVAVVMANVSRSRFSSALGPLPPPSRRAIEGDGPAPRPRRRRAAAPDGTVRALGQGRWAEGSERPQRPAAAVSLGDLLGGDAPSPPRLTCSAKGCRADAAYGLLWNNPRLHTPDRRKTWLACEAHRESLSAFLSVRGFLRDTVPVRELDERD